MTVDDLKNYYKTTYVFEKKTGMNSGSWAYWGQKGYIPARSQLLLQESSNGALVADLNDERDFIKQKLGVLKNDK